MAHPRCKDCVYYQPPLRDGGPHYCAEAVHPKELGAKRCECPMCSCGRVESLPTVSVPSVWTMPYTITCGQSSTAKADHDGRGGGIEYIKSIRDMVGSTMTTCNYEVIDENGDKS